MSILGIGKPQRASRTLRILALLLSYPSAEARRHLPEVRDLLHREGALGASRLAELNALLDWWLGTPPLQVEAQYVQLFDRGRATSLHLFEHVHGESRARGQALVDLARSYEAAGLYLAPGELPDYLPVVLEFASTQPPREARALLGELAHLLNAIFGALQKRRSVYAAVLGALLDLAGEQARAVEIAAEPPLDESWAEPAAFDGCGTCAGQAPRSDSQYVQLVSPRTSTGVAP